MNLKVKYHDPELEPLEFIGGVNVSDWVDLRSAEDVDMEPGEFRLISLGVSIKLPPAYEAHVVPRSSTFKKYGVLQANSFGVIDHSYCGDEDVWMFPAYATRATHISKNDRICQFRIMQIQPQIHFKTVQSLGGQSRGGFGSTGTK